MPVAIAIDPPALYWDAREALAAKSAAVRPLVEGVVVAARVDNPRGRSASLPTAPA